MLFLLLVCVLVAVRAEVECLKKGRETIRGENFGRNFLLRLGTNRKNNRNQPKLPAEKEKFVADEFAIYRISATGVVQNEEVNYYKIIKQKLL